MFNIFYILKHMAIMAESIPIEIEAGLGVTKPSKGSKGFPGQQRIANLEALAEPGPCSIQRGLSGSINLGFAPEANEFFLES